MPKPAARPLTPIAVVSDFQAAHVGNTGILCAAVVIKCGARTWEKILVEAFTAKAAIPSRADHNGPYQWPMMPISAPAEAKAHLFAKIESTLSSVHRVHGVTPVSFPHSITTSHPAGQVQRIRSYGNELAQARIVECYDILCDFHKLDCQQFVYNNIEMWNLAVEVAAPLLEALKAPIVIATDASRSKWGASFAAASSEGHVEGKVANKKLRISELELEGIRFGIRRFRSLYPHRRIQVLCDNKPAIRRAYKDPELGAILESGAVTVRWVRGHSGHGLNDIADRMARQQRNFGEAGFDKEWLTSMREHLQQELMVYLRTKKELGSIFYEPQLTQSDVALAR